MSKLSIFLAAAGLSLAAGAVSAATVDTIYDDNDCSGYFGTGFKNCEIVAYGYDTPIIAKLGSGQDASAGEYNYDVFPGLDDGDFELAHGGTATYMDDGFSYYTATYTVDANDPVMTLFVVKGANDFTIYDSTYVAGDGFFTFDGSVYTMYYLETNMSHVSIYDGGTPPPPPPPSVPLPAAGFFLIGGLGGLAMLKRRRKS